MSTVIDVTNNVDEDRYEIWADGVLAGFTTYRRSPGSVAFLHTEIDQRFERQGLAHQLIAGALDDSRRRELAVLPFCPFVREFIARNPSYAQLVPADDRGRFSL
jgi:predicted GNAT family acetyltransferase